jgi:hypothetical protein
MKASQAGLSADAIYDEHKFLTENFVSGSYLMRVTSTSRDIGSSLEDEYKTAKVLYTGIKELKHTYLAVIPKDVDWSQVAAIFDAYGSKHTTTIVSDMMTQTYWEHCTLEGGLM